MKFMGCGFDFPNILCRTFVPAFVTYHEEYIKNAENITGETEM